MSDDLTPVVSDTQVEREKFLPFQEWHPLAAGVLFGLLLRLAFSGDAGSHWSAMAGSFIFGAPIAVGMLTVYLAERKKRRSWWYYMGAPALATLLMVGGTLIIMVEGLICAIVIVPMFVVMGAAAGLVMGVVCRITNWPEPVLYSAGILPLLLAAFGDSFSPPDPQFGVIENHLYIAAPPATVWQKIHHAPNIEPVEMQQGWAYRIGVPLPLSGQTLETEQGRVHQMHMGKGVHFQGVVQQWEPERYVRWNYRFVPDSFPEGALDDHVLIGGHYFDLIDTEFALQPKAQGTQLTVRIHYRVSTQFNAYANGVARVLLGNFSEVLLNLYRDRSVAVGAR
jgi:uncharacterized protein YndB with AHSA1/START domain